MSRLTDAEYLALPVGLRRQLPASELPESIANRSSGEQSVAPTSNSRTSREVMFADENRDDWPQPVAPMPKSGGGSGLTDTDQSHEKIDTKATPSPEEKPAAPTPHQSFEAMPIVGEGRMPAVEIGGLPSSDEKPALTPTPTEIRVGPSRKSMDEMHAAARACGQRVAADIASHATPSRASYAALSADRYRASRAGLVSLRERVEKLSNVGGASAPDWIDRSAVLSLIDEAIAHQEKKS